ncbi:class I SAM-dependent methyltransferase [Paenibacillus sp. NPDC058174]|uniref:class I SAM-dependent methyltransferase n=1 Tax=Paenibacillus sp. NPDC058174 TaxID=3346366 RepID=UPI0036DAF4A2
MRIGNVNLNLDYYSGNDRYSDGPIEDELLRIVKEKVNIAELLTLENNWPILYHLSPIRRNLLDWIDFRKGGNLLEIGAGCGAMTGLLCEKVHQVTAVELSKKRATITAERYRDISNLEIIVGNWNDIPFVDGTYDYITLIGVLEYASQFTIGEEPYHQFLSQINRCLKPNGSLIIAIENKFGLKYWSGAREDHTGEYFDGLENYVNKNGARTFSKPELEGLLSESGFNEIEFYYPFPDYKLPALIYSDDVLPSVGFTQGTPNYDMDRIRMFEEGLVWDNIIMSNQFPLFSNSFLVLCKKQGENGNG